MYNKFLELVSSPLMNLDHTYRYSGTKLVESESLSQHIVDTIMMGIKMIDEINSRTNESSLSPEKYVMKAVYHDMEEAITGDIPRPLKYYSKATLTSLREVADDIAHEFFLTQFSEWESHYKLWADAKTEDEGFILKLVDMLVVANKVIKEVSFLHNYYMLRVAHEIHHYLEDFYSIDHFADPRINKYLQDIVNGARVSIETILIDHEDFMNNLNVCAQSIL